MRVCDKKECESVIIKSVLPGAKDECEEEERAASHPAPATQLIRPHCRVESRTDHSTHIETRSLDTILELIP